MSSRTPNPFLIKSPFSSPSPSPSKPTTTTTISTSTPLPLSQGLLLSSSSDPLVPLELRLVSLLSYPCTAIVNPISQSPAAYPLMRAKGSMTGVADSGLVDSGLVDPPSRMGMTIGTGIPQISLPGLIDKTAGEDLAKWREKNWKEGLNAGACGVSGSFGLGNGAEAKIGEGKKNGKVRMRMREEEYERPKYIIHTHAPNFADKAYSTPLVKQLLVNCYRGALVEAMGIAEREEKEEERERIKGGDEKQEEEEERVKEKGIASDIEVKKIDENPVFSTSTGEDTILADTEPNTDENMSAEQETTPEIPRKRGIGSFGTINMAGSVSGPASLASPKHVELDASGVSPIASPSILPSTSIPSISSIPPILLPSSISSTSVPLISHDPSKHHIPQSSLKPAGIIIAFPAISTGHKSFPYRLAARIAVGTVRDFLRHPIFGAARRKRIRKVVFCVWPGDSPNRKALQVTFGLNFPPPLPQSAPLSPVTNQLSTPPFSPSVKGKRGFDFKLGMALRDFEGQESEEPKIVVTPPVTPMVGSGLSLSLGSGKRDGDSSGLENLEGERLSRGHEDLGDRGSEIVEEVGMDVDVDVDPEKKETEKDLNVETGRETSEGDGISVDGKLTAEVGQGGEEEELREKLRLRKLEVGEEEKQREVRLLKAELEEELKKEVKRLKTEVEKGELREQVRRLKAEIEKVHGRGDSRGRDRRGRKETYRQRKRQQGLRLAAAMRMRRERERERGGKKGYLNLGENLRVGERDTRMPERMPGIGDGKTEKGVDERIGEQEVDQMNVADEGVRRPEVGDDTGSPESKLSIGEGQAEESQSKDKESQENIKVSGYVRRHGGSETRIKQERRYPEQVGGGDTNVGTKRGRPSRVEGRRPGGVDTERRGGRKLRKRGR
ncbi:hypothetical protein BELL_0033g00060 [Botrytis elliptica]|uniref:Macro domain-containing protein n=1 Tax=Botrytis elliptica TaxID=278938 RepID=A0A4Z1KDW6_9HELO|nr:hypothetical protein BELL_0033g00060 [Botrytis elliptica]